MSPYERLLTEAIPVRPPAREPGQPWTREEQDDHWDALCDAIGMPGTPRPEPTTQTAA